MWQQLRYWLDVCRGTNCCHTELHWHGDTLREFPLRMQFHSCFQHVLLGNGITLASNMTPRKCCVYILKHRQYVCLKTSTYTAFKRMINSLRKLVYPSYNAEQSADSMQSRTYLMYTARTDTGCLASIRRFLENAQHKNWMRVLQIQGIRVR